MNRFEVVCTFVQEHNREVRTFQPKSMTEAQEMIHRLSEAEELYYRYTLYMHVDGQPEPGKLASIGPTC